MRVAAEAFRFQAAAQSLLNALANNFIRIEPAKEQPGFTSLHVNGIAKALFPQEHV